ncbi:MAG TPA: hypothetical protein VL328_07650 [Gemmatimonadaceae bacterium]|jgi:hypothetical protein|nr:hypothetical protein [Gemmatimonadaceae bacterium]
MAELRERDAMVCRACGNEERASEGYPCVKCGTFVCVVCNMRGVVECKACAQKTLPTPKWLED